MNILVFMEAVLSHFGELYFLLIAVLIPINRGNSFACTGVCTGNQMISSAIWNK